MSDSLERERALDISCSFIVQAPAGSGKTGLITQRYLKLLSSVRYPEEIVSITFTKKAAGEMRERIMDALELAENPVPPSNPYERLTWELAVKVMECDRRWDWNILMNPSRLKIRTIDSFTSSLVSRMPCLSRTGGDSTIEKDPEEIYSLAARRVLSLMEKEGDSAEAVRTLLRHMDNNPSVLLKMFISMLAKRDQWLRHILSCSDNDVSALYRRQLEETLEKVVKKSLRETRAAASGLLDSSFIQLARHAGRNMLDDARSNIASLSELNDSLPGCSISDLRAWKGIAEILLTSKHGWRKLVTVKNGFPADKENKARKEEMMTILKGLVDEDEFRERLEMIRILPAVNYDETQWMVLEAIFKVLPLLVQELMKLFNERSKLDFSQVALDAIRSLGSEDSPTDLLLTLDYQIRHILVDEFQDTSLLQYTLLKMLTCGWTGEDGRTMFLVGDPMQSIYLFREAEVGLFFLAKEMGIGNVRLEYIQLKSNFRSTDEIVQWINTTFSHLFPHIVNQECGAVPYSCFEAANNNSSANGKAVDLHFFAARDDLAEAKEVLRIIQQSRAVNPEERIAVLVRSRTHLFSILEVLHSADISYQAEQIETLEKRPIAQDLLALVRALLHPADRIAWLAVLRAPWCALRLDDLYELCSNSTESIWELLNSGMKALSEEGRERAGRFAGVMKKWIGCAAQTGLRRAAEGCWIELGGAACTDERGLCDAELFFSILDDLDSGGFIKPLSRLEKMLSEVYAPIAPGADENLRIMTVHKAKGLEFDRVILPGLGRVSKSENTALMLWTELPEDGLLLASGAQKGNQVYEYIKRIKKDKEKHELLRLFYVAVTRAKYHLHLLGHTSTNAKAETRPAAGSVLGVAWPKLREYLPIEQENQDGATKTDPVRVHPGECRIQRLPLAWRLPEIPLSVVYEDVEISLSQDELKEMPEFLWAGELARKTGMAAHAILQRIAVEEWNPKPEDLHEYIELLGDIPKKNIVMVVKRVSRIITRTLSDPKGAWILGRHGNITDAHSEYSISGVIGGKIVHRVLDRIFLDEDEVRWIVDFKTGEHKGGATVENFLDNELDRYSHQLETYINLLEQLETERRIRAALYYPHLGGWREFGSKTGEKTIT